MRVFKFGGASIKDSAGVRNLQKIITLFKGDSLIVVISAMGKTTNLMEQILDTWYNAPSKVKELYDQLFHYHYAIIHELENNSSEISKFVYPIFQKLSGILQEEPSEEYDYEYDRIIPFGEYLSTTIVSAFLNAHGTPNKLLDAAKMIRTDNRFREGQVDWETTEHLIKDAFQKFPEKIKITQGFIGGTIEKSTTTLGREGSDYTAAIIAYSINATDVTIWKDVPGLLNADPKRFPDAIKLDEIPYEEAIELSYYGATIIHPKTLKPLQNKQIPLFVKSFEAPLEEGSIIADVNPSSYIPSYIIKNNQVLISIYPKDFSFIAVNNLSEIFNVLSDHHVKINLMQNSALSFSICIDHNPTITRSLIEEFSKKYKIKYNEQVDLITIRHYNEAAIEKVIGNKKIFVEQKNRTTLQVVI
ncbi:MAG: aspartate kinase [Bacteroidetes bacterium HGW-Bacteroidetes-19]|nr:MAG: aspartate kinase [Bacteroidetes bacterium HGW-Bacteroidetes-20]PKP28110.1 MAG: aspartate kinase [Bacteroidetes bacterium HGW-Bacteroidetes-19]